MSPPGDVRTFRSSRSMIVIVAVSALLFAAGAVFTYRTQDLSWTTLVFFALSAFGLAGVADVMTQRIELHDDRIVVVRNLRKREYARAGFVKAQWAKGVPVSLQTKSGEWIHLPGVGGSAQGLVNTLRAWIKKGDRS